MLLPEGLTRRLYFNSPKRGLSALEGGWRFLEEGEITPYGLISRPWRSLDVLVRFLRA